MNRTISFLWGRSRRRLLGGIAVAAMTLGLAGPAAAAICTTCPPSPVPLPPPAAPSPPDAVLQFAPCLPQAAAGFLVGQIKGAITSALGQLDLKGNGPQPNPDVRNQCVVAAGRQTVAIWFKPVGSYGPSDTNAQRDGVIPGINILAAGEQFAVRFTASGINHMMSMAWDDVDKQLNLAGQPDPTGSLLLQGFDVAFTDQPSKTIKLTAKGLLDSPFADIHFWGWATDTLFINPATGRIGCSTSTGFDMENSIEEWLANLFADPDVMVNRVLNPGPGCRIAQALPSEVMLPTVPGYTPPGIALKQVFTYTRLTVNSSGLTAGGLTASACRTPSATVYGPTYIRTGWDMPASGNYSVTTTDLRPPLNVTWSSSNAWPAAGPSVTMTWYLPNGSLGQIFNRWLSAKVTDADGMQVFTGKTVQIKYVADPTLPPICDIHPDHFECQ